jgi:phage terminase large subunit-like protein
MTSTTLPAPVPVVGSQQPRVCSYPAYVSTAGDEAVQLAARAGLMLDPWQQLVLRHALGEQANGLWASFEVGLVVPRQNGKGSVLEALELAALFLADPDSPAPLILHSAHEFKTSAEHFRRMRTLVENAPLFNRQVRIIRTAAGAEAIELHSGARLRFVTRSGGSGRGFSADLIVIDEAYNLTAESMAAVLPTLSARPNPQVWYTSSAGMQSSDQLARVRARGVAGDDPTLAYFEWSAADGASLDDREAWAQANPALGLRIPERFVASERAALPDEQFGRERLGLWADRDTVTAIDIAAWSRLADPEAARGLGRCSVWLWPPIAPGRLWRLPGAVLTVICRS